MLDKVKLVYVLYLFTLAKQKYAAVYLLDYIGLPVSKVALLYIFVILYIFFQASRLYRL